MIFSNFVVCFHVYEQNSKQILFFCITVVENTTDANCNSCEFQVCF